MRGKKIKALRRIAKETLKDDLQKAKWNMTDVKAKAPDGVDEEGKPKFKEIDLGFKHGTFALQSEWRRFKKNVFRMERSGDKPKETK